MSVAHKQKKAGAKLTILLYVYIQLTYMILYAKTTYKFLYVAGILAYRYTTILYKCMAVCMAVSHDDVLRKGEDEASFESRESEKRSLCV